MPLVDSNLQSVWDSLYTSYGINGVVRHYERAAMQDYIGPDGERLRTALGIVSGNRVALIGAGFGWVAEQWAAAGVTVIAVDTSTYIQTNKVSNATVTILNESGTTNASRRAIRIALGGQNVTVDWAITEDVLPILTDAECLTLAGHMRNLATRVAHWVSVITPSGDPRLNWKTAAEWKTLMTPDTVVARGSSVAA